MNFLKNYLFFALAFLLVPITFYGQKNFEAELQKIADQYKAVGLAVVVVKDNKIAYQANIGYKDKAQKTPLQEGDLFRIASISKSFTTTSLLQLVENGVLHLDDDVSDLIGFPIRNPHYPDTPITLKMILSHTSSINDSQRYSSLDIINPKKNDTWEKSYNNYKPGTKYDYSNLNYNLAGSILEKWSSTPFHSYVVQHILKPLGLYGGYDVDSLDQGKFAKIYHYNKKTDDYSPSPAAYASIKEKKKDYQMGYSTPLYSPTGGMKISAKDLAKYMIMHMNHGAYPNGHILKKESSELMQSPVIQVSNRADYGLAIRIARDLVDGIELTGHTGSAYGLYSAMFFDPEKKFGFVVITNGSMSGKVGNYNSLLKPTINLLYHQFID